MGHRVMGRLLIIVLIVMISFIGPINNMKGALESYNINHRGTRGGDDWSEPVEIAKYDYTYVPSPVSIVVDSDGEWHIVYSDRIRYENGSQRQFIKYKNLTSTKVLAEACYDLLNTSNEIMGFPSIALDREGGLHVIYTYYSFNDRFNQSVMYLTKEASSGSWSDAQEIARFDYIWIPSRSSIAIDSNGDWHIVYSDRDRHEDGFDRRYIRYKNKSSTETLAEGYGNIFTGDGEGVGHPSIAIDPNGDLHVTYIYLSYDDLDNQTIMYTVKEAGQDSWSNGYKIIEFDYSFKPSYSSIAVDSDGDWHVVYPDRDSEDFYTDTRYVKYMNKESTEILAEGYGKIFNGTGEGVGYPSIAIGPDGDLHVIYTYMDYTDTWNQSIMYTTRGDPDKSSPGLDTDEDGLSDTWELEYFGNLSQGAGGDYDNDGYTNLQEYNGNSNPIDPMSKPSPEKGGSALDHWWIFLVIIVVVVILLVVISLRKRSSAKPEHGSSDLPQDTGEQTKTERKSILPPPPPPKSPLPPPPP